MELPEAIAKACQEGDEPTVKQWLDGGGQIEAVTYCGGLIETKDEYGVTPLIAAACGGQERMIVLLLTRGALVDRAPVIIKLDGVNSEPRRGFNALTVAALEGKIKCVKRLLKGGANPEVEVEPGVSLCHAVASVGKCEVAKLLFESIVGRQRATRWRCRRGSTAAATSMRGSAGSWSTARC